MSDVINWCMFQLIKVEGGLCEGEVIYHDIFKKTPEEIALINKRREEKR
jgi:ribosome biogenesis protein SSF1/2